MPLFRSFRGFEPLLNPLGFGSGDAIELALASLLLAVALTSGRMEAAARRFAARTGWSMAAVAALPVVLRLLLIPRRPIPWPAGADDFGYLLLADTLLHGRLANPPHPMYRFFEAIFVQQEPTYASIFPLGQGLVLAIGRMLFGHPWAGVALSIAAFCALCYWMLRAWTTPGWALVGGILAGIEFGPLNQWMNTYWGGAVSAAAGCLVFGALPRLRQTGRLRYAALLGLGLGVQMLTRPFEFLFLLLSVILFLLPARRLALALLIALPGAGLALLQNKQVTGDWMTLPYQLHRYQYGVPAAFTFEPNPVPHRTLTVQQQLDYRMQSTVHGDGTDTVAAYLERLAYRVRFYRFFFLAPLYLALPFFAGALRELRFAWVALSALLFALGSNFYPYFYPHYIAAVTCLFVLMSVIALERLSRWRPEAARLIVALCAAHFLFWYGVHLFGRDDVARYESWDYITVGDPAGRAEIAKRLAVVPGKLLVFVRYSPLHEFHEWVYNAAEIDASRIVWANDLGTAENEKLRRYYSDRAAWLLEPDARPIALGPYAPEPAVRPPPPQAPEESKPVLKFEPIPKGD